MTQWKDIINFVGSVLIFVGLHEYLSSQGILTQYWWAVLGIGIFLFVYLSKRVNGNIPGSM